MQVALGDDVLSAAVARAPARRSHRPGPGHRPGHRRTSPARAWPPRSREHPRRPASASRRCPPPSCRASACGPTCATRSSWRSASRGTTTDTNRTVDLARDRGAVGARHRQPPRLRPHRQGRRRALHLRRARRGDERGLHQGVLRADRRRASCSPGPSPRRSAARSTRTLVRGAPRRSRRPWRRTHRAAGRHRRRGAAARARQALLGDRRQRHQPHRRRGAAHQAQRALLPVHRLRRHRGQEAHRPVVRAAHPRVRRRPGGLHRRRRGQGGGDLPGPQGLADRRRHRRRGALRGRART